MKRVLVVSDSHGAVDKLDEILSSQPQARIVFHLGDGARDLDDIIHKYPNKYFHRVAGNCDFSSHLPYEVKDEVEGKRIFACHGHTLRVKYGVGSLISAALSEKADIALYGHTHVQGYSYDGGMLIFNPGSVREGKFGALDIAENGILPVLLNLK